MTSLRPVHSLAWGVLALTSCSYDWSLGTDSADALPDTSVVDSGAVVDTTSPPVDTTPAVDVTPPPPDCARLLAAVQSARTAAKRCTPTAKVCEATLLDECGCTSVYADATKPEAGAYSRAVKDFADAGCTKKDAPCGVTCAPPKPDFCSLDDAGGTSCAGP